MFLAVSSCLGIERRRGETGEECVFLRKGEGVVSVSCRVISSALAKMFCLLFFLVEALVVGVCKQLL